MPFSKASSFLALILLAAAPAAWAADGPDKDSVVVATIGDKRVVTERDLEDFRQSEGCYGPDAINSRKAGLMRMLESGVFETVLERAKISISTGEFEQELLRIDRETRAPEMLDCIKAHFQFEKGTGFKGDGRRRYERIFLRKNIVGRKFHDFITSDPRVQGEVFKARDQILKEAGKGEAFAKLAEKYKADYSSRTFTMEEPKEAAGSPAGPPFMRWSPFEKDFIEQHLKDLSPGRMKPSPIEAGDTFQFVKLLSVADGKYHFESLLLKKRSMGDYFLASPKIPCRINDPELRDWVKGITGNSTLWILRIE